MHIFSTPSRCLTLPSANGSFDIGHNAMPRHVCFRLASLKARSRFSPSWAIVVHTVERQPSTDLFPDDNRKCRCFPLNDSQSETADRHTFMDTVNTDATVEMPGGSSTLWEDSRGVFLGGHIELTWLTPCHSSVNHSHMNWQR